MQWWCAAQDVAWTWSWRAYPGVWLFVAALALVYGRLFRATSPDEWQADAFSRRARAGWAGTGILLLWVALDWPVGALGAGYLASVHMVQFLLIGVAAPPLLLLGIPRARVEAWMERSWVRATMRLLGFPLVSMAVFLTVMAFTHWPPAVDTLMVSQLGNFLLDMLWLVAGLVFWWPVAVSLPERPWLTEPYKMGYLIATTLLNTGVFAYLTYSELPLYAIFELAPPVGSLSTRDDQLVAGLLMKIGGAVILWTAISILFFRWYRRSETEDRLPAASSAVTLAAVVLALGACADDAPPAHEFTGVRVAMAIIAEPVTGDRAALYLRVENRGEEPDTLYAVEVEGAGSASLHRTETLDGVMRMTPVENGLEVGPRSALRMGPGGLHVMLEELSRPLEAGDLVPVTVHMRRAGTLRDTARVSALDQLESALNRR